MQIVPLEAAIGVTKDIATISPSVDLSVHLVDFLRCVRQGKLMPRLVGIVFTVFRVFIIEEQVVIFLPVSVADVKDDVGLLEIRMVVAERDVEHTIVSLGEL